MLERVWNATKVTLAIAALVAAALISADKLDRERHEVARRTGPIAEPVVTGSVREPGAR